MKPLLFFVALLLGAASASGDWPQWGGPHRDFTLTGDGPALASHWGDNGPRVLWRRPLGRGLSAVAAKDGALFTMYSDDGEEVVIAMDAATGATRWQFRYRVELHHAYAKSFHQGPAATPAVIAGRVIALGFTGRLHGLDAASGEVRWAYDLVADFGARRLRFGHSASPLIHEGRIIVLVGGEVGAICLDPLSGEVLWRSAPFEVSYASPISVRVDGQDHIIFLSAEEVIAISGDSGELLWRAPCRNGFANNASDPLAKASGLVWVASLPGCGARVLQITRGGKATAVEPVWMAPEINLHYWNALLANNTVYASLGSDGGDFAAIDFRTGRVLWREQGFEKARPLFADGKLILLDETGELALLEPSRQRLEVLAQHQIVAGETRSVPTLVGTTLFVRDISMVMALDLSGKDESPQPDETHEP